MKTQPPGRTVGLRLSAALLALVAATACVGGSSPPIAVTGVSPTRLVELLPTIAGWTEAPAPQGAADAVASVSRVQAHYTQDGDAGELSLMIRDTALDRDFRWPVMGIVSMHRPGSTVRPRATRTITGIGGYPAMVEWTSRDGSGAVEILVESRFFVGVSGRSLSSIDVIRGVFDVIDLRKLEGLR